MKKTALYAAMLALSLPMSTFGLGLGDMKIKSALDQPFLAEIELIDVGSASLSTIKVGVADPENFERVGLDRIAALSLLSFKIVRNDQGKFVILIESKERMSEPYMDLVIDMAWPKGQLYRAYTVLLDPPGYQLQSPTQQTYKSSRGSAGRSYSGESGVVHKTTFSSADHSPVDMNDGKTQTTYGPTITNENVWQIAQHYKTSSVSLPQVVLAIVGANAESFKDGNLNGLKVGVRLVIPATSDIQTVPADLATQEVMAHDTAWNEKKEINHVIAPPYMQNRTAEGELQKNFDLPPVPRLSGSTGPSIATLAKLIQINSAVQIDNKDQPKPSTNIDISDREATTKAEISITTAAVESVRESNALLMTQLKMVQKQNTKLQQQLEKRDKEMELVRAQLQTMMKERVAAASQANSSTTNSDFSYMPPLFLLLFVAAGGGGVALWHFIRRERAAALSSKTNEMSLFQKPNLPEPQSEVEQAEIVPKDFSNEPEIKPEVKKQSTPEETIKEESKPKKAKSSKKKKDVESPMEPVVEQMAPQDSPEAHHDMEVFPAADLPVVTEEVINNEEQINDVQSDSQEQTKPDEAEAPLEFEAVSAQEPIETQELSSEPVIEETPIAPSSEEDTKEEEQVNEVLEFESGLHHLVEEKKETEEVKTEEVEKEENDGIEFISDLSVDTIAQPNIEKIQEENRISENKIDSELNDLDSSLTGFFVDSATDESSDEKSDLIEIDIDSDKTAEKKDSKEENVFDFENVIDNSTSANPLKSTKALDTLISLAKTYIGMDDFESARTSLEEVLEHGNDSQKEEARKLIDQIKE